MESQRSEEVAEHGAIDVSSDTHIIIDGWQRLCEVTEQLNSLLISCRWLPYRVLYGLNHLLSVGATVGL